MYSPRCRAAARPPPLRRRRPPRLIPLRVKHGRLTLYRLPEELDKVNEAFFRYSVGKGEVYEKITCASGYVTIRNTMIDRVNEATWHKSAWFNNIPEWQRRMLIVYTQYTIVELYKQWVADGKNTPVEEVIAMSNRLICTGLDGFRNPEIQQRRR